MKPKVLAITLGDPGGIGIEVTLKAIRNFKGKSRILLIGSLEALNQFNRKFRLGFTFLPVSMKCLMNGLPLQRNVIPVFDVKIPKIKKKFTMGKVSAQNGLMAIESVKYGVDFCLKGIVDALVTAPLNKAAVQETLPSFDGHTEYLKQRAKSKRVAMMFSADKLRMTLVTMHLPLKNVSGAITKKAVAEKIELTHSALKNLFGIRNPRIGVSALNPHGSEFGKEELRVIAPAVKACSKRIPHLSGPIPGDEIFRELWEGKWDAVVAMYHDQGLAPFKMVAFKTGVNLTLGLPFIRTSPDHGTAFDIAHKNKADFHPMLSAILLAEKLANKKQ